MTTTLSKNISQLSRDLASRSKGYSAMNIIQFAEADSGLRLQLHPGQKFIFKLFYNIPLSDDKKVNKIVIRDQFNEEILYEFSEVEFLDFLYKEGRINVSREDLKNIESFEEILFVIGRRGSKSTMTSIIACYTLYLLLLMENPHEFFEMFEEDPIGIAVTANGGVPATKLYKKITSMIKGSKFFIPFIVGGKSAFELLTKAGLEKLKEGKEADSNLIRIESFPASPSVRGDANIIAIMDEAAHFIDSEVSTKAKPLDSVMYEALTPSTATFVGKDGVTYGKSFIMTSPNGPKGLIYNIYKDRFNSKEILVINVPSHWINPKISSKRLRLMYKKSELSFRQEYMAEFVGGADNWIKNIEKLNAQVNLKRKNTIKNGVNGKKYFVGMDFASTNDSMAICVAHYELERSNFESVNGMDDLVTNKDVIVVDYVGILSPDTEGEPLSMDEIMGEVVRVYRHFKIEDGVFDQWAGGLFQREMQKYNLYARQVNATPAQNSEWAKTFRESIMEGRLDLPNDPEMIEELLSLEETVSRNGYVKVENTSEHDDRYDAMSRAIYLVFEKMDVLRRQARKGNKKTVKKRRPVINKALSNEQKRYSHRVAMRGQRVGRV